MNLMTGIVDLTKNSVTRLFNSSIEKEVQKRLSKLSMRELEDRITSAIYYDVQNFQIWLQNYWDPNPIHRNPKFKGLKEFYEMDIDTKVLSCFNQRKDTLVNKPATVLPAIANNETELIKAGFAKHVLGRITNLNDAKKAILSDMDYGYSVCRKNMGYEDVTFYISVKISKTKRETRKVVIKNALVIKSIDHLPPTAFGFDGQKRMFYVTNTNKMIEVTPQMQQSLIRSTFDPRFGSPYGWPLKTGIFPMRIGKKAVLAWRLMYLEKQGIPPIAGEYPAGSDPESPALKKFEEACKGLMNSSVVTYPAGYVIKYLQDMGKSMTMDVFQNYINYADQSVSELVLGHRQATEATSIGSLASSKAKEVELKQAIFETDANRLDTVLAEQAVEFLIDLNFPFNGLYPDHFTYIQEDKDIEERIAAFEAGAALNTTLSETQIRRELHLDPPIDDLDEVTPQDLTRVIQYQGVNSNKNQDNANSSTDTQDKAQLSLDLKRIRQKLVRQRRNRVLRQAAKEKNLLRIEV